MGVLDRNSSTFAVCLVAFAIGTSACAPSARQRPVQGGPVNTGAGSLEATRRQLEGTWTMSKFEVLNAAGQLVAVRAKATLSYDAFGNLAIKGVLLEPLPGQTSVTDAPALQYTGKAMIDNAKHELVLVGMEASVQPDPAILAKVGMDARRKYEVTASQLTMSAMDAQGKITSRATYTK
jgi:hypothetical protein